MAKLAKVKTTETEASVTDFINGISEEQKRKDSFAILEMMKKATGEEPKMWGPAIIGFGNLIYKSPRSGREVEWFRIGFSPRKANFSMYLMGLDRGIRDTLLLKLGKHKTDGGCIYINKLENVDTAVLEELIKAGIKTD